MDNKIQISLPFTPVIHAIPICFVHSQPETCVHLQVVFRSTFFMCLF